MRTLSLAVIVLGQTLNAQSADSVTPAPKIQDNSFLLEEAYNQERGVVQHIGTFLKRRGSSDFDLGFTQEWPLGSIAHQISYDLPVIRIGSSTGVGDVAINYRYQLKGDGDAAIAITPRSSLLVPSGDWKRSRGNGSFGGELALAGSFVISRFLATHANAGLALTPAAKNPAGEKAAIYEWSVAQSVILTSSTLVQPMLEVVYSRGTEVTGRDRTSSIESFVVSPGARAAINFASGLQIVPGFAVPVGVGASSGDRGVFMYLSFEHAFRR